MRKVLNKRRRMLVCLLIIIFVMQSIFGQAMFALAAEPDSKETGNIMNVELQIGYSGAETLKPVDEAIKSNIKFEVKVKDKGSEGEGETVDEKYVTVSNESDSLSRLSMTNYDPDKEYTIVASLDYEGKVCSYTFDYGAMSTPEATYDAAVFDAVQKITVKPVVSEAVDKTFTITWWDGSDADKKRPSTTGYDKTLTDCLQYSTDNGATWQKYNPDEDITLGFSSSVKENDDNTWSFECKGLAKQVDGKDAIYRLSLPFNPPDNDQYVLKKYDYDNYSSYQYSYCADFTGTIVWNNSALADDARPSVDDIALDLYYIDANNDEVQRPAAFVSKNTYIDTTGKNWTYTIKNLVSYDSNGKRVVYVVKERPTATDKTINGFEYSIAYDNKSVSAATDVCYNGGYIVNTVKENIDLSFDVNWVEPDSITPDRPEVTYSLWRYAEGKTVPGTSERYDYSTAAMVTYWQGGTKNTVSEKHDWSDSDTWKSNVDTFKIELASGDTVSYPQYDEEGYRYVYFLKQTDAKMSTDVPGYIETFKDSEGNTVDETVIYNNGSVTNTYNEQVKLNLSKTWKNVKHTSDYRDKTVNLVVTRGIKNGDTFTKDADYEETISLSDFSSQINSKSDFIMADRYDSAGNEYVYKVQEQILNGYSVELKSEESTTYELNNHSYTCSIKESDGKETDKDGQTIVTHTYKVTNEETEMYDVKFVKQWGSTYKDIEFDDLPGITAYLRQDGELYATISMAKVGDAVKAVINYRDGSKTESDVTLSADKKTWTLDEPIKAPVSNSDNSDYVYTFSEKGVTPPEGEGETTYYNVSYATSSLLGKETITGTITNNHHVPEEYAYRGIWLYKKWNDDGDASKRSAIDAHVVIVDKDGTIKYDLSKTDDRTKFVDDLKDDTLKEKVTKELAESNQSARISAGNSWQKEIVVPKNLDAYAQGINPDYSFTVVEAGLYTVDGTSVIPYIENADSLINNDKQQYKLQSSNSEGKNSFTFTNTRNTQMKVETEFDWNDFTNKAGVRPEKVKVTLTRYEGDDKNNIDAGFKLEKTVDISATADETTETISTGVDEFASNGKAYHYVAVLEYLDKDGKVIDADNYDVKPTTSYTEPVLGSDDKLSNSELTFKYEYDLNDNVSTRDVSFYKIWRDEAKKNDRPDLALKLYQKSDAAGSDYKYLRNASVKCDMINAYAQKYTYFDLPEYTVIRDKDGKATGVELYTYHAKEVINTSDADIYYSYIYAPDKSAMKVDGFTSYAGIADWDTYVKADYADDYKTSAEYADENGCFVNGISENLVYTGTKTWMTMPKGTTKDHYPYVEFYFFQSKSSATEAEKAKLTEDIETWKTEGREELRKHAIKYTTLDDATRTNFADEMKLPKYDDQGALYRYTIVECIYRPSGADGTAKMLPDFIMSTKSNGIGTNVFFTNKFETEKNQRNLILQKSWTKISSETNLPTAKFVIYRVEKKDSDDYITDVESLDAADKTIVETVYLNADKTTYKAEKTITGLPIYSPQGNEYVYYAVEDTTYAPSYGVIGYTAVDCDQTDATILDKSKTDTSKDYGHVMFSTVCKLEGGVPVEQKNIGDKIAFFKNEKKTVKTTLTGTVKWVDTDNTFNTRPEDKLVYLTVKRSSANQKDSENDAHNEINQTLTTGSGEWLTQGSDDGFAASDTSDAVYKVKIDGTTDEYIYIRWKQNSDNTWTYTITDKDGNAPFDVYADNGNQWKYYVTENKTEGADYQYFAENYTGYGSQVSGNLTGTEDNYSYNMNLITNTLGAKITLQKQWSDTRDQYHFRPVSLQIYFQYKLSTESTWHDYSTDPITLDNNVTWKKVFDKLPKENNAGVSYEFRVVESKIIINYPKAGTTDGTTESKEIGVKYYENNGSDDKLISVDRTKTDLSSKTESVNSREMYIGKAGSYTVKIPKTIAPGTSGSVFFYNTLEENDVVSLPITKTWDDESAYKDVRPKTVYVKVQKAVLAEADVSESALNSATWEDVLQTDGKSPLVLTLTASDADKNDDSGNTWTKTYNQLPKIDAVTGNVCFYRAVETDKDGVIKTFDDSEPNYSIIGSYKGTAKYIIDSSGTTDTPYSTELTNDYVSGMDLTITKNWNDDSNRDGKRPDNVTVKVEYHDFDSDKGTTKSWKTFDTVTLGKDKDNNYSWSKTLNNLPKYYFTETNHEKTLMEYRVSETAVTSYTTSYKIGDTAVTTGLPTVSCAEDSTVEKTITVDNTYTPEKGNLTVEKKWTDNNNADGERPTSIDTNIYRVYKDSSNNEHKEYYNGTGWAELGASETAPVTKLNSTGSWKVSLKNLPLKTNIGGNTGDTAVPGTSYAYTYYFKEVTSHDRYNVDKTEVSTALANNATKELNITNTLKMVKINVDFTWDDLKNKYETRKDYELVVQRKSGTDTTYSDAKDKDVLETSAADTKQTYSFENLPMYDADNNKYDYQVVLRHKGDSSTDIVVSTAPANPVQDGAYQINNSSFTTTGTEAAGLITYSTAVTAKLPLVTVTGQVTWDDQNNKFAVRPAAADYEMTLEQGLTTTDPNLTTSVKCTAVTGNDNAYSYSFTDLRKYDDSGNLITYKVSEAVNANYTASSDESETKVAGGTGVTYQVKDNIDPTNATTYTKTTINNALNTYEIKLTKSLQKADPATEFSFDVYIKKNGAWEKYNTETYKLKTGNTTVVAEMLKGCEFKIVELDVKGKYTVSADAVETGTETAVTLTQGLPDRDYYASAKADSAVTVTFHNGGLPLSTVTVTKNWTGENKYTSISERPQNIYFILQRATAAADEEAVWDTITEDSAVKVWTVNETTAAAHTDTQWKYDISGMPTHSSDNKWFTYRAVETDKDGNPLANDRLANYAASSENCVLTNAYIVADLDVAVNWSDANDAEKLRPDKVDCTLYYFDAAADEWKKLEEPVTIAKDDWNYSYKNLPVYDSDGNPIKYKVEQNEVDKYTTSYSPKEIQLSPTGKNEIKINNYHAIPETVKKINVKAEVSWNDYDNSFDTRESIDFVLQSYVNGKWQNVADPITGNAYKRTADGSWKATFYDLPLYDNNDKQIYYRVVIDSFGGVKDVVNMKDAADKNGINGNKQNGSVGVYTADAATTFNDSDDNAYYLTHINCTYAYKLAIDNVTQNPVDKNKTNAGGKVQVLDDIDLSDFDIDKVPDPDQASGSGYKSVKLGVFWKAEEYWTADNDFTIVYTTKAGEKKTLNLNIKDLMEGKLSKQAKEDFPNIAIYEKDGKYVLILADKVTEMPKSVDVRVSFKPTYGIVNLTKGHAGGIVRNASGQFDSYSDGIKEIDGHGKYTNPKVLATAEKGYCVDMNNLYLSCKDEYSDISGREYQAMVVKLQPAAVTRGISDLQDSKHKIKVSGNTFSATVWTVIDGKRKATVVNGTIKTKKNSNGEVTELTMSTSFKYPLVYGVKFIKEGENAESDKPGGNSSGGSHNNGNPDADNQHNGQDSSYNDSVNSVATGDETPVEILLLLLLSSCGGLAVLHGRRKNDQK